jgi:glycosyltransferase involved in cell wall biosynthesis
MLINQWVPAAHKGDAIGDSARRVRDLLRGLGHDSDLYALTIDDALKRDVRPFTDPAARRGDITIFHYALPSSMTAAFASLDSGRVLQYHNVTPAEYFAPFDPALFRLAALGRQELATLPGRVDLALGDSEYNRQELESLGFARTGVFPIAVNTARITQAAPRPSLEEILDDGLVNFLFVGRIAPNKKIEDVIKLAEVYKRYIDAYYRFIFVGRYDVVPRYYSMIRALMAEYRLLNDRFVFTGPVPDEELAVYYRQAAVYISLSEHEGFCVPLIESFYKQVPVLAYAATAVPATMDGGGVLYHTKDPFEIARLMDAILGDARVEEAIVASQNAALARLMAKDFAGTLLAFVDEVRTAPPRSAPEVPYDFWALFDQAERLEELRQFRPALYRALPRAEDEGRRKEVRTLPTPSSVLRPLSSGAKP